MPGGGGPFEAGTYLGHKGISVWQSEGTFLLYVRHAGGMRQQGAKLTLPEPRRAPSARTTFIVGYGCNIYEDYLMRVFPLEGRIAHANRWNVFQINASDGGRYELKLALLNEPWIDS